MIHYMEFAGTVAALKRGAQSGADYESTFLGDNANIDRTLDNLRNSQYKLEGQASRVIKLLGNATVFEINEDLAKACALHKYRSKQFLLPHDPMFVNVEFSSDKFDLGGRGRIVGLLITKSNLVDSKNVNTVGHAINAITIAHGPGKAGDDKVWLDSATFNKTFLNPDMKSYKQIHHRIPEAKFLENLTNNILAFINDPEVQLIKFERSQKNALRRMKHGQMPLPDSIQVKLTGHLKVYIDQFGLKTKHGTTGWHYNYRFPVRSHKRRYRDQSTGQVIKEVEIKGYIKGEGPLIDKSYKLDVKK